jgi:nucleoredoxin
MKKLFLILLLPFLAVSLKASLEDLFPETLLNAKGEEVDRSVLDGKIVGIYFSASWCPPCRDFTPLLVKFHEANKEDFVVVFVSSDRTPADHLKYMADYNMNFFTLPHRGAAGNALAQRFNVRGIPHLAVVGPDGEVLAANGRMDVQQRPGTALATWTKPGSDSVGRSQRR